MSYLWDLFQMARRAEIFGTNNVCPGCVTLARKGFIQKRFELRLTGTPNACLEFMGPPHRNFPSIEDAQWLYYTVNSKWHNCRQFQFRRQILPLHDFVISLSDLSSQRPGILPMVFWVGSPEFLSEVHWLRTKPLWKMTQQLTVSRRRK